VPARLSHRGRGHRGHGGEVDVVGPDEGDVLGHPAAGAQPTGTLVADEAELRHGLLHPLRVTGRTRSGRFSTLETMPRETPLVAATSSTGARRHEPDLGLDREAAERRLPNRTA
jgi:hypothetical protein